jgi:hypothetical protein
METKHRIRPNYNCCHPNQHGTGCSVRFELHPAHDNVEGSVFITFAAQKTVGSFENGHRIFPTFDWANNITVRLNVIEIASMLEVFRGYREKMGDGNGIFHATASANTIITLEHRLEPSPGFLFGVSRKPVDGTIRRMKVLLEMREAIALTEALSGALVFMAFGIPQIIERKSSTPGTVATTPDTK